MRPDSPCRTWARQVWDPDAPYPRGLAAALDTIDVDFVQPQRVWVLTGLVSGRVGELLGARWWSAFGLHTAGAPPADDPERERVFAGLTIVSRQVHLVRHQQELYADELVSRQAVSLCVERTRGLAWAVVLEDRLRGAIPPDLAEIDRWRRVLHASLKVRDILEEAGDATSNG